MPQKKTLLTPEEITQIETMSGLGLSSEYMASILGISKRTLERRISYTPGAKDVLDRGRAKAALKVTKTAFEQAVSGRVPAMTMFWLKCRQRWKETSAHEVSGPDGKPIETKDISQKSDAEISSRIKELLAKRDKET